MLGKGASMRSFNASSERTGSCRFVIAPFLALLLAACGSDGGSAGSSGNTTENAPATDSAGTASEAEGEGATKLGDATIGILNILAESEVTSHWQQTTEKAVAELGMQSITSDGKGDPSVWAQVLSNYVRQGVDGIIIIGGVQEGPIASQLEDAQEAGIPVVVTGVRSPDPAGYFSGIYAPDDGEFGVALAEYLVDKLPPNSEWVALLLTADEGANAPNVTALPILEEAGHKRVGTVDITIAANIAQQVTKGAADLLRAHPEAKLLFGCCDFTPALTVPVLEQAGYPDVIHSARYDNLSTLNLIREGKPVVVAAANADMGPLIAVDQLAAHIATGAEIDPNAAEGVFEFTIVDETNVPPEDEFFYDPDEQIAEFVSKWQSEYEL